MVGPFMNFSRLTDKALREYNAARAELLLYVAPPDEFRIGPYLRAIDHMENCVSAIYRAVLNAQALRANKIGRAAPRLTQLQEQRLKGLRDAVEHSDEKLLGKQVLTYKELVSAMRTERGTRSQSPGSFSCGRQRTWRS
jgi:hypothetical protein